MFQRDFTIQSIFTIGSVNGKLIDNTLESVLNAWIDRLIEIQPREVMLYTIDRDTPIDTLQKIPKSDLERIVPKPEEVGVKPIISY